MKQITKLIFLLMLICCCGQAFAQSKNETFYAYKSDWRPASSIDVCAYFMVEIKKSDTEYVCRYYNKTGPMIKQETYRNDSLTIPNGRFCWYNEQGKIDSCGWVTNFKKDGRWEHFYGDSSKPTFYEEYDNGKFIKRSSYNIHDGVREVKI
jgi:antitoxin component YwqK of YwqJK toxin-antitoxin module